MRLWVHLIWLETNPEKTLQTAGPREDRKLEELIRQFTEEGELTAAIAWHLYVNEDPRPYNLAPVSIALKSTSSKTGKSWIDQADDHSSVTRFPLSAFLAVCEGYVIRARLLLEKVKQKEPDALKAVSPAYKAMRKQVGTVRSQWGAAHEFDEETA